MLELTSSFLIHAAGGARGSNSEEVTGLDIISLDSAILVKFMDQTLRRTLEENRFVVNVCFSSLHTFLCFFDYPEIHLNYDWEVFLGLQ